MGSGKSKVVIRDQYSLKVNTVVGASTPEGQVTYQEMHTPKPQEIQDLADSYSEYYYQSSIKGFNRLSEETITRNLDLVNVDYGISPSKLRNVHGGVSSVSVDSMLPGEEFNALLSINLVEKLSSEYLKQVGSGNRLVSQFGFTTSILDGKVGGVTIEGRHIGIPETSLVASLDSLGSNWTSVSLPATGVTAHEIGHTLELRLENGGGRSMNSIEDMKSNKYITNLSKFQNKVSEANLDAVSIYGTYSPKEAFAEAFSLYAHGVTKSNLGSQYYEEFKTLMTDVGLTGMFGVVKEVYSKTSKLNAPVKTPKVPKVDTKVTPVPHAGTKPTTPKVSKKVKSVAPPNTPNTKPIASREGKIMTVTINGVSSNFTITPARSKRGFFTFTVEGVTYRVNTRSHSVKVV